MYQPPSQPPSNQANKAWGTGCAVLLALSLLIAACGKPSDTLTAADRASESAAAAARISEAISGTPTPTPSETPSDSPSPTPTGIDAAARKACTLHVQAVALRDAGWTSKADDQDDAAEEAVWESTVLEFAGFDVPQQLDDWCATNLPEVHAKPVTKKPVDRPKPAKSTAPSVPEGATAICNDGTVSYSRHRQGTCSHHNGVRTWL